MRFKVSVCQVLCLVITIILHSSTAQNESVSMEALMDLKLDKFEHKLTEKLQAQNNEVIMKQTESIGNLERFIENLKAGQMEIQNQLTNMMKDLQQHHLVHHSVKRTEASIELENSHEHLNAPEKLIGLALNEQTTDGNTNLGHITDEFPAGQSENRKQLTNVTNGSIVGKQSHTALIPSSCAKVNANGTGTYSIQPVGAVEPVLVRCDFEYNYNLGGGWSVFQRRYDGSVDFYRNWTMYKNGFGDVEGEYWLGLETLHVMTRLDSHELLIVLEDFDDHHSYAYYDFFKVSGEDEKYKLNFGHYSGKAGDSLKRHIGMQFSTFDKYNVRLGVNCAEKYRGGWWFNDCFSSHLNGAYFGKSEHIRYNNQGVFWLGWKDLNYSLKSTKMMLRRRSC